MRGVRRLIAPVVELFKPRSVRPMANHSTAPTTPATVHVEVILPTPGPSPIVKVISSVAIATVITISTIQSSSPVEVNTQPAPVARTVAPSSPGHSRAVTTSVSAAATPKSVAKYNTAISSSSGRATRDPRNTAVQPADPAGQMGRPTLLDGLILLSVFLMLVYINKTPSGTVVLEILRGSGALNMALRAANSGLERACQRWPWLSPVRRWLKRVAPQPIIREIGREMRRAAARWWDGLWGWVNDLLAAVMRSLLSAFA